MARATLRVEGATLVARADDARAIPVGTPAWYAWLDRATTFAFVGPQGRFTAHKQPRGPAGSAWRANCKRAGLARSAYLGRSADLTLERLQTVAATLAAPVTPGHDSAVPLAEPTTPAAATFPTGTVTFLFTDIEGSTTLWEQQPQAMSAALARHDAILRETIAAHGGMVFKTVGDAFHAVFTTASAAIDAALALQQALHAEGARSTCQLHVRVALHTGVAELRDGDYFGPALNRVARLLAAAHGGQILLSLATEELVRDQLPPHVTLRDLGTHPLKDLRHPEQIFQLVTADLPVDFPPLHTAPQLQSPAPDLALLTSKLTVPPPRPKLLPRPRLFERLQAGLNGPLTLIAAPAGYGKTTLLASWLASVERRTQSAEQEALSQAERGDNQSFDALRSRVAWVTLDAEDNDPQRFWRYVLTALDGVAPGIAATPLALLQSPQPPAIEAVLTPLLNALNTAASDVALVLDDYHLIATAPIHRAVTFLLDHLPARLHLVIASRTDPPLPLGRLRARDQLTEIRAADLRFSVEEASAFFSEVMDLDLRPAEVAALERRTEGWIAGLQLAALSLRGQGNRAEFIAAFTGSHRYVLDYLLDEVLACQSEEVQSFLLQTAVLERLTGPLCEQLTGQHESAQLLKHLERSNLFIVPLDAERTWYRYHHLFGQLLRSRLQELWPKRVPELHLQASAWYQDNDFPTDAIQHALAAEAVDQVAILMEAVGPAVYMRGETATVLRWCQALPETMLQTRPPLCLLYAAALHSAGHLDAAEARLNQLAEQELAPSAQSMAAMLRAANACVRGDMPRAEVCAREALATAADLDLASVQISLSHLPQFLASSVLVESLAVQGKTAEALAVCQQALERAQRLLLQHPWSVVVGQLHLQLSRLHYERDELDAAALHAAAHLDICQQAGHEGYMAYGHAVLARVRQAQGRPHHALEHIQAAVAIAQQWQASAEVVQAMSHLVGVWLMRGDLDAVRKWAQAYQERGGTDEAGFRLLGIRRDIGDIALARALLAMGQVTPASRLLDQLAAQAQASEQWGNLFEIRTLQALALQAQGQLTDALQALEQALAPSERAGYYRLFVDGGAEMAALLTALLRARRLEHVPAEAGASTAYVRRLLAAFPKAQTVERRAQNQAAPALRSTLERSNALVEPLSERELEVLRLIVAGYSNPEIGQRLVIATGTVKRHINSIFSKLDVRSRAQAIARAREMNLA